MPLPPGRRLGPYEIVAAAGSGGMGEVYRARDTRLGREVAVKVLPAGVASDEELRQRLDREARAISSLSHPHICSLFDVGHQDGIDFLVMEYLEGETLAARLSRGALPADQVIRYGIEIAGALAAAHRKGIVHRDLKPGNVMLTRTGAKLLDFGLAKPAPTGVHLAGAAPTISAPITTEGTLVGTYQYMSPEQVEGRDADARSDIFALGAVLHEMATGRRAFDGKTTASVIAAVLEREPPAVSSLQPLAPAAFDDLVRGCLAKDPDERWQTAHDVKLQLQALQKRAAAAPAEALRPGNRREWIGWALAVAATLAAFGLGAALLRRDAPDVRGLRAFMLPPPGHSFARDDFAIAPDGTRLAYIATGADGVSTLWVTSLETSAASEVTGTEGASSLFWSPDSRWIGFFARGRLMKVEPGGAGLQSIANVEPLARYGAWSPEGVIVFSNQMFGPLVRVDASGGTPVEVTSLQKDQAVGAHRFPQFLSDGRRFLYLVTWTSPERSGLYLASLDGGAPELVSADIRSRVVLAGGHLMYVSGSTVYAMPFDERRGRPAGSPKPLLRNELAWDWRFGEMPLSASHTGRIVFQSRQTYQSRLVWYDRNGAEQNAVGSPGFSSPVLSPDAQRVAVTFDPTGAGQDRVWVLDLQRNITTQLTRDGIDTHHAWSGDGRWIAYSSQRSSFGIFRRPADGSGREELLLESPTHLLVNSSTFDGSRLLYMNFTAENPELRMLHADTKAHELIGNGAEGAYSPDGKWIAYIAVGGPGILIRPASGSSRTIQVSDGPGSQARWRRDMTELFYVAPDKKMMTVPLTIRGDVLEPGKPVPLFQTRIIEPRLVLFQYDVTADGQRFLINSLPREDAAAPLTLLDNWPKALGR